MRKRDRKISSVRNIDGLIRKVDVVIMVIDARNPNGTRAKDIEKRIKNYGKRFIIAINKCDLISQEDAERIKKKLSKVGPTVFTSATKKLGTSKLREAIRTTAPKLAAKVIMVGYPNVGKSQLSNALKGKSAARVSPVPGHTRSQQWIAVSKNIRLYDTPGVIPRWESEQSLALKFAIDPDKIKLPEKAAADILQYLIRRDEEIIFSRYGVVGSPEEILVEIAKRRGKLLKGGIPDTIAAAKIVIREWNKGVLSTTKKEEE